MSKWALRDNLLASNSGTIAFGPLTQNVRGFSIEAMLDGGAAKPWAYRQLVPSIVNLADRLTPINAKSWLRDHLLSKLSPAKFFTRAGSADKPDLQFRYVLVYYISFISLLLALFVLRRLLLDLGLERAAATVAPAGFLLALPYIQTLGGYFYDNVEIVFLALVTLSALRGSTLCVLALIPLATLNKETFFFFIPTLYPLLSYSKGPMRALWTVGAGVALAGLINVIIKYLFLGAPGGAAELHLIDNVVFYLNPTNYFEIEITYGLVGPSELFFGTALVIALIVIRGWQTCPLTIRQHLLFTATINLPLFFLFAKEENSVT
jgi:hypothetical protein